MLEEITQWMTSPPTNGSITTIVCSVASLMLITLDIIIKKARK